MPNPTPWPFRPAPGLSNPHLQSIAGKVLRPGVDVLLRRERLELPDGDFVDLDFAGVEERGGRRPQVLVLHGLEGTADRPYMRTTYAALLDSGLSPVGLNFRGCSGEPNRTPRAYHSGDTADVRFVAERLRDRFGGPCGIVGYSLGGNVTLKLLGEMGEAASGLVGAAVAVSVPFDLDAGCRRIGEGLMGRVYTAYFMRSLLRKVRGKADVLDGHVDVAAVLAARDLRAFDEAMTAPVHGFADAADYYTRSSSQRFINGIRVPTLVIHAEDDPFLPPERIPRAAMEANPAVTPLITRHGGHVGFIAGSILRPRFWAEEMLAAFLAERLRAGGR